MGHMLLLLLSYVAPYMLWFKKHTKKDADLASSGVWLKKCITTKVILLGCLIAVIKIRPHLLIDESTVYNNDERKFGGDFGKGLLWCASLNVSENKAENCAKKKKKMFISFKYVSDERCTSSQPWHQNSCALLDRQWHDPCCAHHWNI